MEKWVAFRSLVHSPVPKALTRILTRPIHMGAARTKHWHLKTCHGVRKLCCSQNQLSLRSLPLCPQRQEFCWLSNFRQNVELDWKQKEKQTKVPHPPVLGAQRAEGCWRDACLAGLPKTHRTVHAPLWASKATNKRKKIKASHALWQQEALPGISQPSFGNPTAVQGTMKVARPHGFPWETTAGSRTEQDKAYKTRLPTTQVSWYSNCPGDRSN